MRTAPDLLRLGPLSLIWRRRMVLACLAMIALCLCLAVLLLGSGSARLTPAEVWAGLGGTGEPAANRLIGRIRLPRVLTAALVGAALGMAGAVFQSLSRNALGSPDVIGFTTGAATGAVSQIILWNAGAAQTAAAAVVSGVLTALAVLLLARRGGAAGGGYRLILVGIGVGAVLSGVNTLLLAKGDLERAMSAQIWLAGSLNARNYGHVWTALAGLCLFAPLAVLNARRLSVLEMGEDMASQLGIAVGRLRIVMVLAAVGLASVATACTGPIAFIALAAPQLARRLTGSPGVPVISGAIAGAALLMAADLAGQNAPRGLMMPIGLTTGFLGGLYLIVLLSLARRL